MKTEIETMLRAITPDLDGLPLYVVLGSELPTRELLPMSARGFAGEGLDLALKPFLDSHDLWNGRGPCIVINDELIEEDAREASASERELEQGILATALHEMSHSLEAEFRLTEPDDYLEAEHRQQRAEADVIASADLWSKPLPEDLPPWLAHESEFLRVANHLHARAGWAGYNVPLSFVFRGANFGLSSEIKYAAALGDEPAELAGLSFSELRGTQPPAAFVKLWCADVRKTFLLHRAPSDRCVGLCAAELLKYQ